MTISITRQRVVVLLTSVALALVLLFAFVITAAADQADASIGGETATVTHVVRSGDTLWDIAVAAAPAGSDVRDAVEDIKRINGLTSSLIMPGQVLIVPVGG
jgi:nucleoid-associated protein YgaU